jgi:IclR family pca regulon transcriptional regulator
VRALAVPLRDMRGRVVAALNVVGAPERMPVARLQSPFLPLLWEAAREMRPLL